MLYYSDDDARKNPGLAEHCRAVIGDGFQVGRVLSGDFSALDTPLTLGIERKTFPNLCSSMLSGELDIQLARLADTYNLAVLLVEGLPVPRGDGRVVVWGAQKRLPYAWIMGTLVGWFARGVWPLMVENVGSTPMAVAAMYHFVQKPNHRTTFKPKQVVSPLRRMGFVEATMLGFPGVGEKRAAEVAALGLPLAALAALDEKQWVALLGKSLGARVAAQWRAM